MNALKWFNKDKKIMIKKIVISISIAVDFFYQITFFISLIVLDEKRIKQNCFDFFICCKANENLTISTQSSKKTVKKKSLMERYTITVLFCLVFLFVGSAYIAFGIETAIDGIAIYPQGSFVASKTFVIPTSVICCPHLWHFVINRLVTVSTIIR